MPGHTTSILLYVPKLLTREYLCCAARLCFSFCPLANTCRHTSPDRGIILMSTIFASYGVGKLSRARPATQSSQATLEAKLLTTQLYPIPRQVPYLSLDIPFFFSAASVVAQALIVFVSGSSQGWGGSSSIPCYPHPSIILERHLDPLAP